MNDSNQYEAMQSVQRSNEILWHEKFILRDVWLGQVADFWTSEHTNTTNEESFSKWMVAIQKM